MTRYGGQAVFEGVMMRGRATYAVAVRRPDGGIEVLEAPLPAWGRGLEDVPVVRGVVALAQALPLGFRSLTWSAEHGLGQVRPRPPRWWERVATVLVVAAVIVLASAVPAMIAVRVAALVGVRPLAPVVETALGVAMLYGYLRAVGRVGDVVRLFANHGAEHKVVNAWEAGAPLTVASVQRFSTRHPRCGTSFLLIVAVVSAAFFAVVGGAGPVLRVAALPLVAGIAAEIQLRLAAMERSWLARPGMALQRLTTREPSDAQVEVAIAALQAVLAMELGPGAALEHAGGSEGEHAGDVPPGDRPRLVLGGNLYASRTNPRPEARRRAGATQDAIPTVRTGALQIDGRNGNCRRIEAR